MTLITIDKAQIQGITKSGALLLEGDGQGYRIELGPSGVEILSLLLQSYHQRLSGDCSIRSSSTADLAEMD